MVILQDKHIQVMRPADIVKLLQEWFKTLDKVDNKKEYYIVIHLNVRNEVQCIEIVSIGILNAALVHPRETFKRAVIQSSANIIVAHNHPSEDCTPSSEDREVTERLQDTGKVLGIQLIDHIIFGTSEYFSFADEGLI